MDDFKRRQLTVMTDGIRTPDEESRRECLRRWDAIAKPIKGLGRLEELTAHIASIQRTPDFSVDKRALVVFCADNGITQEGVTQTDSSVTAAVAAALAKGSASANAMAAVADADIIPIDIGIAGEVSEPGITNCKIRQGTADFLKGPAMETDEALEAILTGIQTVSRLKDMGYDIIAAGEMGIGNTTTSAAVAAVMLGLTPEEAAGRGAGLSDEGLNRKTEVIRKGMELHDAGPEEPLDVLAALGGLDMAGICGLMLGGAIYGVPIVMDGIVSCAAALLADTIAPASRDYIIPSHEGREPVCRRAMEALGFSPVIHADLALGEGTGALLLFPMLSMAQAVYRQDTTFEDMDITPYEHFEHPDPPGKAMEKVTFVGAGPGAPDLLTIKGKQVIDSADVVIYAGSLVNPAVLSGCKKDAEIYNSAGMTLEDVIGVMERAVREGKKVARVHTGDPSLYGAEREQMRRLDSLGISYEVVPGVSSFLAAAASLKREYTLPGVSQSVILTRMEGRTAVPDGESISSLASHQASMVVFLSIAEADILCERLISGGYPADTPAAVVYKASWDDEKVLEGTLTDIAGKVRESGITRTALLLIGRFLEDDFEDSKLYDKNFSHGFRSAETFHAKRIMIQGTMSGAGKSFVTAAFCRIFRQDGYTVAPFKSQNMALNSAVTPEGLEIGRAQAMQAEAAGIEASAAMNPILLKPTGDEESQVIVRGEVACSMSASEYYDKKAALIPVIEKSFRELADVYDIVVMEGAGSPAEINLKDDDIVNMGMARMADAPVILVADIDRGGVFAQIVGTVELMEPDERARIKGIIINKFRGDADLLRPGIEPIEKRLGIPVLGIIPMEQIDLDEEDSLAPRLENKRITPSSSTIDIAVVRLPHISNFTDFSVLERWEGVSLSYVTDVESLYSADLVIIPGTKNTFGDLAWLKASGLADAIKDISDSRKATVIGICGGYQMMGESLCDPEGAEGVKGAVMQGLGLLPVTTVFAGKKTRSRSSGVMTGEAAVSLGYGVGEGLTDEEDTAADHTLEGYEIHMGKTSLSNDENGDGCFPFLTFPDGSTDGCVRADGLCMGTYLHGLFNNIRFTGHILKRAGAKKGITAAEPDEDVRDYRERQYDRLADIVRCSVDMDAVYRILDESTAGQGEKRHD